MIFNAISFAAFAALSTGYAAMPLAYCLIAAVLGAALSILIDKR